MALTKDEIVQGLRNSAQRITFKKVDGTERIGSFTLVSEHLPLRQANEINEDETKLHRPADPSIVRMYDLEKKAWRSMKVSSFISWYPLDYNWVNPED
jgi:hypothetical protein